MWKAEPFCKRLESMDPKTILILDDNLLNLKVVSLLLKQEGFHVVTVSESIAGLNKIRQLRPDLVLLDLQLPGMDGIQIARRLKSDPATADITLIAITAYATAQAKQQAAEAGFSGYVTKPIDTRVLPDLIRSHLTSK